MGGRDTTDGLTWWAGPGQDQMQGLRRVSDHPGVARAVRCLCAGMLDLASRDRQLAAVFKDAGRYVATMLVFLLHETGELTVPRLKADCARSGLLSEGRARALVQFLEHLSCVERRPGPGSGRAAVYRLTPRFQAAWAAHLRAALAAGAVLEPALARIAERPEQVRAFGRVHAGMLLERVGDWGEPPALIRVLQHPHAGSQILWTLILTGQGDEVAPERCGPISISDFSKRFDVSRVHIKRVLREGEAQGLLRLDSDGTIALQPLARDQIRILFPLQLAHILAAAARATVTDDQKCAVGMTSAAE